MITAEKNQHAFRVYINQILHLDIPSGNYAGCQAWIQGRNLFVIEISLKEGPPILCEYDQRDHWQQILKLIDQLL